MKKQLKPKEVADRFQISSAQLCRLTKAGKIPAKDMGTGKNHCWRYDEEQLEKWIIAPTQREPAPRRRMRLATPVQREKHQQEKSPSIQHINGEARGTQCPITEL